MRKSNIKFLVPVQKLNHIIQIPHKPRLVLPPTMQLF